MCNDHLRAFRWHQWLSSDYVTLNKYAPCRNTGLNSSLSVWALCFFLFHLWICRKTTWNFMFSRFVFFFFKAFLCLNWVHKQKPSEMFPFVQPTLAGWWVNAGRCFKVADTILSLTGSGMQISNRSAQMVLMLRLISAQPFLFPLPSLLALAEQDL